MEKGTKRIVKLTVNKEFHEIAINLNRTLLEVLRDICARQGISWPAGRGPARSATSPSAPPANAMVNNGSSEIIRMFNAAFDACGAAPGDFYPEELRQGIDAWNARIYDTVNNGAYKAGFATTQEAYEAAFGELFATLDVLEEHLSTNRYLLGNRLTEADWRLFTTLVRFDPVYVGHFKCNLRRIADYPNLSGYLRELYQRPGIAETVDMRHIKGHYYGSHRSINPSGITPMGPMVDLTLPHLRG